MKWLVFLLFSVYCSVATAQNCTQYALMKKGAQLEYDEYSPKIDAMGHSRGYVKRSHIVFEVENVTDSTGSIFSTIMKKGIGINDAQDHCERKIVLQCDGRNLLFSFDFYLADTVFLSDINDNYKSKGYYSANTPLVDVIAYVIPLTLEGVDSLRGGVRAFERKTMMRSFSDEHTIYQSEYNATIAIRGIVMAGKENISTAAGSFDCYKFYIDSDQKTKVYSAPTRYFLFFNQEAGLVKMEGPGGYLELVSVKK